MDDIRNMYGFELLQKLYHDEIQKKEDAIILLVHWYLIKCGFRCIGRGDERTYDASEKGSELLPKQWNSFPNFSLRYIIDGKLYILLGIKSDDDLLLNLLKYENSAISNISFPIEKTVSTLHGSLETMIPSYQTILRNIQKDFVEQVYPHVTTNEATTQTVPHENDETTKRTWELSRPASTRLISPCCTRPLQCPPEHDPARVGVRDLNPFGQGGGMIFDPASIRTNRRLPSGLGVPGILQPDAIPPGARFDPFGPPDTNQQRLFQRRPGDDHLQPPGYDDMFM